MVVDLPVIVGGLIVVEVADVGFVVFRIAIVPEAGIDDVQGRNPVLLQRGVQVPGPCPGDGVRAVGLPRSTVNVTEPPGFLYRLRWRST